MKQRVYFMDCLNIVAIMAVILLHTSGTVFSYRMDNHWLLAVLMQVIFIWAVPIFFMLSGANLLNYSERYDTKTFFKKRWARVVVPFIFWSIVWYLYTAQQNKQGLSVIKFIDNFLSGSITPTFWFFYDIIAFYLAVPFLTKLFTVANKDSLKYLLCLMLGVQSLLAYFLGIFHQHIFSLFTHIPLVSNQYFIFFCLGWFLKNTNDFQRRKKLIYFLGIISVIAMFLLTVFLSYNQGRLDDAGFQLFGLPVVLLTLSIWLLCESMFQSKFILAHGNFIKILRELSAASLGIYCIHLFLLQGLSNLLKLNDNSLKYMLILPILV
ncbi:MAG: acyltransferase, partial [Bacillota bacterium]|nr:acyltransferase [Bacillota bacterium]